MKKVLLLLFLFCGLAHQSFADHLKGGFFTYEYLGAGTTSNTSRYHVKLTVYITCAFTSGQISNPIPFTFFDAGTNQMYQNVEVQLSQQYYLRRVGTDPCINGDQSSCYYILIYDLASIDLPNNAAGYTVAYQRCCRIINIINLTIPSNNVGNTFSIKIPGTNSPTGVQKNSSPVFLVNDTAVVCYSHYFETAFVANDPDGDSLSYYFCDAYTGGGQVADGTTGPNTAAPDPAANPPYNSVPYAVGFTGSSPLGPQVTINSKTGLISGIAPPNMGEYVVSVCVNEYRQGIFIGTTKKELHLKVGDCNPVSALPIAFDINGIQVNPDYSSCNGYIYNFLDKDSGNPLIHSYTWDFGDGGTSISSTPSHTYLDTGAYVVKLTINKSEQCNKTDSTIIHVYPGFFPGFVFSGVCSNHPTLFTDTSKTTFGTINSWSWDFGNSNATNDTSHVQNPNYTYPQQGTYPVRFIVTSSKGCIDTVYQNVAITDKPPIVLAFRDTLICRGDTLQLHALGTGNFVWTPSSNIINTTTPDPTVFPIATSNYFVQLNQNGCINNDTVRVRVISVVTVIPMPDTTICATDAIQLKSTTDGLKFLWTPATGLNNPNTLTPIASPAVTTTYTLTSSVGHCSTSASIKVKVVPYPKANAGADTIICFNTPAQLHANITGSSFSWSPSSSLNNSNSLSPLATPSSTTSYVLTVLDTLGCPKPGRDTILVTVLPKVIAYAGRDTTVVIGQPLQFNATGGTSYSWSPPAFLNHSNIANPIGIYDGSVDSIRYFVTVTNAAGCSDVAQVYVKIYKTDPKIFVPSAFTPNGDGKNDIIRPIAVGISKINYFRIYNRWGQMVFSTSDEGKGWDGKISGQPQSSGVYVWIVQGEDFTGKIVFAKGTVTLIR